MIVKIGDNMVIQKDKFSQDEWLAMEKTVDLFGRIKSTEQAEARWRRQSIYLDV